MTASHTEQTPNFFLQKLRSHTRASQYGTPLDLDQVYPELVKQPLLLNGQTSTSNNPNRYKQHGFHFNADNCIACHACESACSEKNNLPPHLAFRKVGYLEGGSYPDVMRLNVSMACNHCEDPVCLKACPTRAYTKYAEYGAVLQDPDICFGCGYCTWVCPYNAPQLDPVKGQVEKCNMCVDRLEQGLKPACVAACLGNALEFGVIEDMPAGREQTRLDIPGFPDPSITRPNIRFQQTRSLPSSLQRSDGVPIQYQREATGTSPFKTKARSQNALSEWGISKLSSRENPLVVFTLLSQWAVGGFLALFFLPQFSADAARVKSLQPLGWSACLFALLGLQAVALFLSASHLGKPQRFYRGFNNLRHSWLSREAAALSAFFGLLGGYAITNAFPVFTAWLPPTFADYVPMITGWGAALFGPLAIYCMVRIYRIKARPFWDHWHTAGAFFASLLVLGSLGAGILFGLVSMTAHQPLTGVLQLLSLPLIAGFLLQGVSLWGHWRYLEKRGAEAEVSKMQMQTTYGKTYRARWFSLALLFVGTALFSLYTLNETAALLVWSALLLFTLAHEIVGRALFYVLVTPTTMPGAFFWNNKYFETHARKVGLAQMPQVGVVPDTH